MQHDRIPAVIDAGELASLIEARPETRLLDVRTPGEYESVHIRGAYNVPLDTLDEHADEIRAALDAPVVLICRSGTRARQAEAALQECSMQNLHVLEGGVLGWLGAGLPVVRGPRRLSLERQVRIVAGTLAATGGVLAIVVNPWFGLLPLFVGSGLLFAGVTDTCGLAILLSRLPWNRAATCDVPAMVDALKRGSAPRGIGAGTTAGRNCAA